MKSTDKRTKPKRQPNEKQPSLSSFSLAAAISEASSITRPISQQKQQPRKIFNIFSPLGSANRKSESASQQSIATNTSFATANESVIPASETPTPAASYFVDSSDDETDDQGFNYTNDPLARLSRTESSTPTEISFSSTNPEKTMPSKRSTSSKNATAPVAEVVAPSTTAVVATTVDVAPAKADPSAVRAGALNTAKEGDAHFDVAQNVYATAKSVWAWGRTVPLLTNLLGMTEAVAAKVVDITVHMDLLAVDEKAVTPQLKKLDDDVMTPVILAVWKLIEPAIAKGDKMVVKPVLTELVPRVLAPLAMFDNKKNEEEEKKQKEEMIDASPTPEVVPALN